ncbi:MAG: glycosyltransferase, partial [Deltaproteobacteria bacterium]|nr:glycosyltransferase [Deltaproteobacteria bacterium]
SVALQAGFDSASGRLIVTMDADLQDQPEEIPKLINHLAENNLDVVGGWKLSRQDPASKIWPSRFFNFILRRFSGLPLHDFNCGLKVLRRECLANLVLYGQLHRFLLFILAQQGFSVGEAPVKHSPRLFGQSKYRAGRLYQGLMDFLTVLLITRYLRSPLYFFGFYGLACWLASLVIGAFYATTHIISVAADWPQGNLAEHPAWLVSPFLFLGGLVFICFGLLGEFMLHLNARQANQGQVARRLGFGSPPPQEPDKK